MNYSFHPEAEEEFISAIMYYEDRQKRLGEEFAREVYKAVKEIIIHPRMWPWFDENIRRRILNRFPYSILYSVDRDEICILAVMHLHRNPDYWKSRL